ncbi:MAG: type II toxin-antitoxin system PemK/MazF family toxin [Pseudomonadota bacterium]
MVVRQGEIYWVELDPPQGSGPGFRRPCVIIQNNTFNASGISTVVVAVITGNLHLGRAFGNVLIRRGEAGLPKKCVVNISQIATVDRSMLNGRIGMVGSTRLREILLGITSLLKPIE